MHVTEGWIVIILVAVSNPIDPEDAVLMNRVAQGDRRAFLELYDRHSARVLGLSLRILGDAMTAEEVAQDAFLRLWTRADMFNPGRGKLLSWLLTITKRLALDRIRLENRRPQLAEGSNPAEHLVDLPDPKSTTEEARWSTLRFALEELPADQRSAIELAFYYGMSHSQIADYLDTPLGTVKTRLRIGMQKLRRSWADENRSDSGSETLTKEGAISADDT